MNTTIQQLQTELTEAQTELESLETGSSFLWTKKGPAAMAAVKAAKKALRELEN